MGIVFRLFQGRPNYKTGRRGSETFRVRGDDRIPCQGRSPLGDTGPRREAARRMARKDNRLCQGARGGFQLHGPRGIRGGSGNGGKALEKGSRMPRSSRKIVASKASVHADGFTKENRIRQTSAHHAFHTTADGDVKIRIEKQYLKRDSDAERPSAGSVIRGDSAELSARIMHGPYQSKVFKGQKVKNVEGNVRAVVYTGEGKDGSAGKAGERRSLRRRRRCPPTESPSTPTSASRRRKPRPSGTPPSARGGCAHDRGGRRRDGRGEGGMGAPGRRQHRQAGAPGGEGIPRVGVHSRTLHPRPRADRRGAAAGNHPHRRPRGGGEDRRRGRRGLTSWPAPRGGPGGCASSPASARGGGAES